MSAEKFIVFVFACQFELCFYRDTRSNTISCFLHLPLIPVHIDDNAKCSQHMDFLLLGLSSSLCDDGGFLSCCGCDLKCQSIEHLAAFLSCDEQLQFSCFRAYPCRRCGTYEMTSFILHGVVPTCLPKFGIAAMVAMLLARSRGIPLTWDCQPNCAGIAPASDAVPHWYVRMADGVVALYRN